MQRLVDYLVDVPEGTNVLMVGFTDDVGAFDSNRDLSKSRAEEVVEMLRELAGEQLDTVQISSAGYGEIAPSACNTTEKGRSINRRVEVWIEAAVQG